MENANIYAVLKAAFPANSAKPCLIRPNLPAISYGQLDALTAQVAHLLTSMGVQPGDRVAVQVEKSAENLALYLGCVRMGAVYLPLNTGYTPSEMAYFLNDAEPKLLVCEPDKHDALQPLLPPDAAALTLDAQGQGTFSDALYDQPHTDIIYMAQEHDLAALLYTSGTTGRAKAAMITHGNLVSNVRTLHKSWGFAPNDVLLHSLPIYHVHGLFVASHCALYNGSSMIWLSNFDAAQVMQHLPQATVFMGVPTHYTRLLAQASFNQDTCRSMRLFVSGSAPLLADTHREFLQRSGHAILERYGMTETGMNTSNPYAGERRCGTVGMPLPGVSIRIADAQGKPVAQGEIGIIEIKGPNVCAGYWRNPEKTKAEFRPDGYFISGDMATQSADGYISIVGRAKDLIISGGLNVYPKEIEECLDALPGVLESAVFGVPHPDFGEAVVAAITLKAGSSVLPEALQAEARQQLAAFKAPKRIFILSALPRNAMGKVQKNQLRQQYQNLFTAAAE